MSLKSNNKSPNIFESYEISNNFCYKDYQTNLNLLKNDINQYQLKEIIGEGMFGKVKLAIHLITNEKVAIKIFDKGKIKSSKEAQYIEREISILQKLNHYNTIKLYNIIQNDDFIFLVQEYIPGRELLNFIEQNDNLSEKDICKLYQQIISGIEYMHEMGIAHRDLKLENILLNYKKDIKIIDFGLSNSYDKNADELLHSSCGSPCYAAPEMIKGIEYRGINTDIWSSGIILYLMLCKSFPFNDKNNSKLYKKILSGKFNVPNILSNDAKDLIINLLKVNPQERIKINEIKNHPWFNIINKSKNFFKGIDINKTILPIDEDIIREMRKFGIERNIIITNLLKNNFNNITTTYNLLLQKKIRSGKKSVADFCSDLYMNYINDEKNQFFFYNNDIELIIKNRINNNSVNLKVLIPPPINNEYGNYNKTNNNTINCNKNIKYYHNNFFTKPFLKMISKSDENTNRQISEREKEKNLVLFFPVKFRTIDHDSYSNSKQKRKANKNFKNKSPNLSQFHTKKNMINHNNNIYIKKNFNNININTIKNTGYSLNKYLEKLPTTNNYNKMKKSNDLYLRLLNKKITDKNYNKHNLLNFGNLPNYYKQYVFNKSVDNKYSYENHNHNHNNNFYNNNTKINKLTQIRKKLKEPVEIKKNQKTIDEQNLNHIKTKKDPSFLIVYNNINMDLDKNNNKTFTQFFKQKISKEKSKNKSNNKTKPHPQINYSQNSHNNNNNNYIIINNINNNNKNLKNVVNLNLNLNLNLNNNNHNNNNNINHHHNNSHNNNLSITNNSNNTNCITETITYNNNTSTIGTNNSSNINNTNNKSINNNKNKRNNFLKEERDKDNKHKLLYSLSQQKDKFKEKKTKSKKTASNSVDLNMRNQEKYNLNIYTNKPKRKNVMKFINKNNNNNNYNNNNDLNVNMNYKYNNIYNKYGYCYKNEMKKNMHNKSLELNYNKF